MLECRFSAARMSATSAAIVFVDISVLRMARLLGIEVGARPSFNFDENEFRRFRANTVARAR